MAEKKSDLIYSTIAGTIGGFVAGLVMGGIQLLYVPELAGTFAQSVVILMICALGWAGYGAIAGGGGAFARGTQTEDTGAEAEISVAGMRRAG
jgi:hypothetical protein